MLLKNVRVLSELTPGYETGLVDIVISGDRIEKIMEAGSVEGAGLDMEGKTVLPGFIDAHVHLDLAGTNVYEENTRSDATRTAHAIARGMATLRNGFTTVRDLGDRNNIIIDLANAIDEGYVMGPDILASGKIISPTESGNQYFDGMYLEADGTDEVMKAVRTQLQAGAKWIKYMGTGAFMNPGGVPGAPIYTQAEINMMVETAKMHNVPVVGHSHGVDGMKMAINAGVRTVEHGCCLNDEVIELLLQTDETFLCPTVGFFEVWAGQDVGHYMDESKKKIIDELFKKLKVAYDKGIKMGFGTDAGVYEGGHGDNAIEFHTRCDIIGMDPITVLQQATKYNAEILLIDNEVGTIEAGKKANLVVIDGCPDKNIDEVRNVSLVIKGGEVVK